MDHSDEIEAKVRFEVEKLEEFAGPLISCRVVIDVPHRHHQEGNLYQVRIDLRVPGEEIPVSRWSPEHSQDRDAQVAVREAFDEARRQLEDYARRRRGQVKFHAETPHARVSKILPDEGYGFLTTPEGREIYFHKNSVLHDEFSKLEIGTEVRFVEEAGQEGPQASTVEMVGRHGGL
jgi:cold shock CspA family protein